MIGSAYRVRWAARTVETLLQPGKNDSTLPSGYLPATGLFVAAWLALSLPWLFGNLTIPYDAKAHFQAQIQFLANSLHSGQSPLWSPYVFVGTPHVADPQSLIFSPAYLLAYFDAIPSFRHLDIYVLTLLGLGGLAMMGLCRDRGWHPAGAVVTGIVFAFGASAAWRIQHIGQVQSYAFFAIALWLLLRTLDRSSVRYGILTGLAAGAMVVEPDQVALLGIYILAAFTIGHWWRVDWGTDWLRRNIGPLAAAAGAGLIIVAVPLLLTTLYALSSNRPSIDFAEAVRGALHPASLLTAVIGDLYGALDPKVAYWGPYSEAWDARELFLSQNMGQVYLGALPILLLLAIGLGRGLLFAREIRVAVLAAVLLVLYAVGARTPVFRLIYDLLPGVAMFRRPADATFLMGAMAAIIAGYLVHLWASGSIPRGTVRQRAAGAAIIAALFLTAGWIAASAGKLDVAAKPLFVALAWILASAALLAARHKRAMAHPLLVMAAPAALLTADLAWNNGPNESTALPTANYDILKPNCRNPTIRFLKERLRRSPGSPWRDRVELVGLGFEWPNASMIHGFDHTLGYNPLRIGLVSRAVGAQDTIAGPDQRAFSPLFPSYRSMLADLLGLRFIASSVPVEKVDPTLQRGDLVLIARTSDAYIYENPRVLPRVLFVTDWQHADFAQMMTDGRWPDFDPRRTVLLDGEPEIAGAPDGSDGDASQPQAHDIGLMSYENTLVEIDVESDRPGFVVLNDAWHPWWTASVDGVEVPVLRANVLFRAVHVAAGHHIVRFEFRPFSGAVSELGEKLFGGPKKPERIAQPASLIHQAPQAPGDAGQLPITRLQDW